MRCQGHHVLFVQKDTDMFGISLAFANEVDVLALMKSRPVQLAVNVPLAHDELNHAKLDGQHRFLLLVPCLDC